MYARTEYDSEYEIRIYSFGKSNLYTIGGKLNQIKQKRTQKWAHTFSSVDLFVVYELFSNNSSAQLKSSFDVIQFFRMQLHSTNFFALK